VYLRNALAKKYLNASKEWMAVRFSERTPVSGPAQWQDPGASRA
jgi:hypothetical protein